MNNLFSFLKNGNDSNFKEVLLNGGRAFVFKISGLFLGYLVMLLITKKYGADVFGRYSLTITLAQLLVMIFTFGLPTAIVKLTSDNATFDRIPKSNFFKKGATIIFFSGVLVSLFLFFSAHFLSISLFKDNLLTNYFRILSLLLIPLMFHEYLSNFFRGKKDFTKYNLFTFIFPYVFFFILFYILEHYYKSEDVILLSYTMGIGIVFLIELLSYLKFNFKPRVRYDGKKLLKLSLPMMFSTALLFLLSWTDIFMLGFMRSSTEVGIYNAAFKIASIGYLIIIPINVIIGPKVSELFSTNQLDALKNVIHKTTRTVALLTIPIAVIIMIGSHFILGFFGEEFIAGQTALIVITIGVLISASSGNVDQILNMTNNQGILRNVTIFCFILNVLLNYFLIPLYGINGAAIASLITHICLNGFCIYYIKKTLGFYTLF